MSREIDLLRFPRIRRDLGRRTDKHRAIAREFGEAFFDGRRETGYGGYEDDGRWRQVAARIAMHYGLGAGSRVLDVGCAKGFLVKAFRDLGIQAWGIDVSQYAYEKSAAPLWHAVADARELTSWPPTAKFDLVVAINTLHNLERDELGKVLRSLDAMAPQKYITLDAWRDAEGKARMEMWNLTALTMMSVEQWKRFFAESGYTGDYFWFMP